MNIFIQAMPSIVNYQTSQYEQIYFNTENYMYSKTW